MATARIVLLTLDPAAADDFFNIRFRAIAAPVNAWTDFYTTGSTLEDLSVSLLSSNVYTLDGINSPSGNEALASAAGNEYQVRYKDGSVYGNWSTLPISSAYEPEASGPFADVSRLIRDMSDLMTALDFTNQEEADQFLGQALTDAMDELREAEGIDALYTGTSTASQKRRLKAVEILIVKALVYEKAMDMKAQGMHAPLLVEESRELQERAEYYRRRAMERLEGIIQGSTLIESARYNPANYARIFTRAGTEW